MEDDKKEAETETGSHEKTAPLSLDEINEVINEIRF
jgi:hypothetical protein